MRCKRSMVLPVVIELSEQLLDGQCDQRECPNYNAQRTATNNESNQNLLETIGIFCSLRTVVQEVNSLRSNDSYAIAIEYGIRPCQEQMAAALV